MILNKGSSSSFHTRYTFLGSLQGHFTINPIYPKTSPFHGFPYYTTPRFTSHITKSFLGILGLDLGVVHGILVGVAVKGGSRGTLSPKP